MCPGNLVGRSVSPIWSVPSIHSPIPNRICSFGLECPCIFSPIARPHYYAGGQGCACSLFSHPPRAVNQCAAERDGMGRGHGDKGRVPRRSCQAATIIVRTFSRLISSTAFLVSFISIRRAFFCCSTLKRNQKNKGEQGSRGGDLLDVGLVRRWRAEDGECRSTIWGRQVVKKVL